MKFDFYYKHFILGACLYIGMGIFFASAIIGQSTISNKIPEWMNIYITIMVYAIIPLSVYIGFFTKFHNPFIKQQNQTEVHS